MFYSKYKHLIIAGIIMLLILVLCRVSILSMLLFSTTYLWHLSLYDQRDGDREELNKYSFIKVILKFSSLVSMKLDKHKIRYKDHLVRLIVPNSFWVVILLIFSTGNVLFSLLASVIFEGILIYKAKREDQLNDH